MLPILVALPVDIIDQVTAVFEVPVTGAENCTVPTLRTTVAVVGEMLIPTGVELPPHPASKAANKNAAPTLNDLIPSPPKQCPRPALVSWPLAAVQNLDASLI
jgi:hypothetical protein